MKKTISIVLAMMLVLAMAVTAFAADANIPGNAPGPVFYAPNAVVHIIGEEPVEEENPDTGYAMPVSAIGAGIVLVAAAALAVSKRK